MWTLCGKLTGIIHPQRVHTRVQGFCTRKTLANYQTWLVIVSLAQIFRSLSLGVITNTYGIYCKKV